MAAMAGKMKENGEDLEERRTAKMEEIGCPFLFPLYIFLVFKINN